MAESDVHDFGRFDVSNLWIDLQVAAILGDVLYEACDLVNGLEEVSPLVLCQTVWGRVVPCETVFPSAIYWSVENCLLN